MNDETALKELLSMYRIYSKRGQEEKAQECLLLAREIESRLGQRDDTTLRDILSHSDRSNFVHSSGSHSSATHGSVGQHTKLPAPQNDELYRAAI